MPRLDDVPDFGTVSSASKTGGLGRSVACAAIADNSGAGTSLLFRDSSSNLSKSTEDGAS
jgi:hypothetical protein